MQAGLLPTLSTKVVFSAINDRVESSCRRKTARKAKQINRWLVDNGSLDVALNSLKM